MQFTVKNKCLLSVLLILCFLSNACGQTKEEKIKIGLEHAKKAAALQEKGDFKNALLEQLLSIALTPNDAESHVVISGIYMDLEEWQKAVESAQKAVNLKPDYANAHYALAIALRRTKDTEKTLESFKKVLQLTPNDTNVWINLGATYEDSLDRLSARKCYEKAIEIDAEYVPAIYLLGELEKEDGKFENAIKLFKKASEIKIPENRQAEQSGSQRDAKKRLEELKEKKKL